MVNDERGPGGRQRQPRTGWPPSLQRPPVLPLPAIRCFFWHLKKLNTDRFAAPWLVDQPASKCRLILKQATRDACVTTRPGPRHESRSSAWAADPEQETVLPHRTRLSPGGAWPVPVARNWPDVFAAVASNRPAKSAIEPRVFFKVAEKPCWNESISYLAGRTGCRSTVVQPLGNRSPSHRQRLPPRLSDCRRHAWSAGRRPEPSAPPSAQNTSCAGPAGRQRHRLHRKDWQNDRNRNTERSCSSASAPGSPRITSPPAPAPPARIRHGDRLRPPTIRAGQGPARRQGIDAKKALTPKSLGTSAITKPTEDAAKQARKWGHRVVRGIRVNGVMAGRNLEVPFFQAGWNHRFGQSKLRSFPVPRRRPQYLRRAGGWSGAPELTAWTFLRPISLVVTCSPRGPTIARRLNGGGLWPDFVGSVALYNRKSGRPWTRRIR